MLYVFVARVRVVLLDAVHADFAEDLRLLRASHAGELTRDSGVAVHLSRVNQVLLPMQAWSMSGFCRHLAAASAFEGAPTP